MRQLPSGVFGNDRLPMVVVVGTVVAALIVALLLMAPVISVTESTTDWGFTLEHWEALWNDPTTATTALNTVGFVAATVFWSLLFGVPLAWLVARTDIRGKRVVWALMMVGFLIPGFFIAMGWLFLLHPRIGTINRWLMDIFGTSSGPLDIQSVAGMGFVEGLQLTPLIFLFVSASLRAMDASHEEAAQMSGASTATTLRRVTLPLALPGLLGASLYTATVALAAFDTPLILGLSDRTFVFSTSLYANSATDRLGVPVYGPSAAFATITIVLAVAMTWWYARVLQQSRRFAVITGRSYRQKLTRLGRWRWLAYAGIATYYSLSLAFPLLLLVWSSLQAYVQPISSSAFETASLDNYERIPWDVLLDGLGNTFALMLVVPTAALAISLAFSWIVLRSRYRFRMAYEYVAFVPQAVPIVIFAFAALVAALYVIPDPIDLYGTLTLIAIVLTLGLVAFGTRMTNSSLVQVHPELEESGQMAGASPRTVLRRVILPLLRPALAFAWIWMALLVFRQLTVPLMLQSPESRTGSVVVYSLFAGGDTGVASAISILMILILVPLAVIVLKLSKADPRDHAGI